MTVYSEIKSDQAIPREVIEQVRTASKFPVVPDEDCPEYSYEELMRMRDKAKDTRGGTRIVLHVTEDTVEKAKTYGENYRTILGRLLSLAIDDKEMVHRAML